MLVKRLKVAVILILGFYAISLQAEQKSFGPTDAEVKTLPPYCQARLRGTPDSKKLWAQRIGTPWKNIHHYCTALNSLNRARFIVDKKERRFELNRSRSQFDYVLNSGAWPPNHPLTNEAKIYKNQVELMLKQR